MKIKKYITLILIASMISIILLPQPSMASKEKDNITTHTALLNAPGEIRYLNSSSFAAPIDQVRSLLRTQFVDQVSEETLNAATIGETLELLGDPYTSYMSAEEYSNFINPSFTGIGIYIEDKPEGVGVKSVIPESPAAGGGLQAGDIITQVREQGAEQWTSLSGLSLDQAGDYIRGQENTVVNLTVLRGNTLLEYTLTRKKIAIPPLEYSLLDGSTGYLDLGSFLNNESGSSTASLFTSALADLEKQRANGYIIDLRDNGGGYVSNALDIAGHFIGSQTAILTDYRNATIADKAYAHDELITKPMIVITNENSASASEILSAALKDYHVALFLGKNTYGKGCMQGMYYIFNENAPADYFKMTIARYRSPLGNTVDKVGIAPDIPLSVNDPLLAARLLLSASPQDENKSGLLKLSLSNQEFAISSSKARTAEYWPVMAEVLDSLNASCLMLEQSNEWAPVTPQALEARWPLYYPGYNLVSSLSKAANQEITIRFSEAFNPLSVNAANIELREKDSGQSIALSYETLSNTELKVQPVMPLVPGKTYWLLLHPGEDSITSTASSKLNSGYISVINCPSATAQSLRQLDSLTVKPEAGDPGFFPNLS
ncbi:MAG: S41 family peptidase [Syntrophomonas sp.]